MMNVATSIMMQITLQGFVRQESSSGAGPAEPDKTDRKESSRKDGQSRMNGFIPRSFTKDARHLVDKIRDSGRLDEPRAVHAHPRLDADDDLRGAVRDKERERVRLRTQDR